MEDKLFDTKDKAEAATSHFKTLLDHPGWKLVEQILDQNIEFTANKILEGGEETTKKQMDLARGMLKFMKETRNTPRDMIEKLTSPEKQEPTLDPFETVDQLKKGRIEVDATP